MPVPVPEGLIVRLALALFADVAVIPAVVWEDTAVVFTVNVPATEPAGIVIEATTVADGELLARLTNTPFAPAGDASVTVPKDD